MILGQLSIGSVKKLTFHLTSNHQLPLSILIKLWERRVGCSYVVQTSKVPLCGLSFVWAFPQLLSTYIKFGARIREWIHWKFCFPYF